MAENIAVLFDKVFGDGDESSASGSMLKPKKVKPVPVVVVEPEAVVPAVEAEPVEAPKADAGEVRARAMQAEMSLGVVRAAASAATAAAASLDASKQMRDAIAALEQKSGKRASYRFEVQRDKETGLISTIIANPIDE